MKKRENTFLIGTHFSGSLSAPVGAALPLAPSRCEGPLKTHADGDMCRGEGMRMQKGFTLIETLVAITLLTVAIVAPMSLTSRSLAAAYYARDQITSFHLAQEGIEAVRHVRDHNVLENALGVQTDLLAGIPDTTGQPFTVDARNDAMALCPSGNPPESGCSQLSTNGQLYGYPSGGDTTCSAGVAPDGSCWAATLFRRSITAQFVGQSTDEVRISVTVSWQTGSFQTRSFTISENMYRWPKNQGA